MDAVRSRFDRISTEEQAELAVAFPDLLGNLNGAPFPVRDLANRTKVGPALAAAEERLAELIDFSETVSAGGPVGLRQLRSKLAGEINQAGEEISATSKAIRFYTSLTESRSGGQLLYFDRNESAGTIFLTHPIEEDTSQLIYFLTGAGTDKSALGKITKIGEGFADPSGREPVIVFAPAEFPRASANVPLQIAKGWSSRYAEELSSRLAEFAPAVLQELSAHSADPEIAALGWSYGMSAVGRAQAGMPDRNPRLRLDAHRIIDAAGVGAGVSDSEQLRRSDGSMPSVAAIVVDGDPYRAASPVMVKSGIATSHVAGAVTYPAGNYHADYKVEALRGTPITGGQGHGNLLWSGTDSFDLVFSLLRGQRVSNDVRPPDAVDRVSRVVLAASRAVNAVSGEIEDRSSQRTGRTRRRDRPNSGRSKGR